jgi:hypothetical protein
MQSLILKGLIDSKDPKKVQLRPWPPLYQSLSENPHNLQTSVNRSQWVENRQFCDHNVTKPDKTPRRRSPQTLSSVSNFHAFPKPIVATRPVQNQVPTSLLWDSQRPLAESMTCQSAISHVRVAVAAVTPPQPFVFPVRLISLRSGVLAVLWLCIRALTSFAADISTTMLLPANLPLRSDPKVSL